MADPMTIRTTTRRLRWACFAAVASLIAACAGNGVSDPDGTALPADGTVHEAVAFRDVKVIPMDSPGVLPGLTVIVRDRRIEAVGPAADVVVPDDAVVIDGSGRYLLPGLADMHVHLDEADLRAYLDHGITTVRNMWGYGAIRDMRERVAYGEIPGPVIHTTSPGIDDRPEHWPYTQIVETPEEATATVDRLVADEGWSMLKVYQDLRPESYDAIVAVAGRHGVRFMGHVPHRVGLRHVLEAGQASVEHLGGFDIELGGSRGPAGWLDMDPDRIPEVVGWTVDAGAYVCPTLAIVRTMASRNLAAASADAVTRNRQTLVGALHGAGVPILAGSDAGIEVVAPGESLHDELGLLVGAGLSPFEALRASTVTAAAFLRADDEFGAVREGLRADLILLSDNPLDDIAAAASPLGVMANGVWYVPGG